MVLVRTEGFSFDTRIPLGGEVIFECTMVSTFEIGQNISGYREGNCSRLPPAARRTMMFKKATPTSAPGYSQPDARIASSGVALDMDNTSAYTRVGVLLTFSPVLEVMAMGLLIPPSAPRT